MAGGTNLIISQSAKETKAIAERLAKGLSPGDVVALSGELGSGKTTFVKGLGKGLNVENCKYINSPTFVLIKEYYGRLPLYHLDLYRLDNLSDIRNLGLEEYLYGDGITVIEWAERLKELLPSRHISIRFKIIDRNKREVVIEDFRN